MFGIGNKNKISKDTLNTDTPLVSTEHVSSGVEGSQEQQQARLERLKGLANEAGIITTRNAQIASDESRTESSSVQEGESRNIPVAGESSETAVLVHTISSK